MPGEKEAIGLGSPTSESKGKSGLSWSSAVGSLWVAGRRDRTKSASALGTPRFLLPGPPSRADDGNL